MFEKMRKSDVFANPWLPALLCVVLVGLWFTRWELQASKTYDDAVFKWYTDRWTGKAWVHGSSVEVSGRAPITSLEGDAAQEYRIAVKRQAENLTKIWGCAAVVSLLWLGFAMTEARRRAVTPSSQ